MKQVIKKTLPRVSLLIQSALVFLLVLVLLSVAEACPGCKDAIAENDSESMRVAKGYFWSILFMMSMPFAILGTFGTYIFLEVRRAKADRKQLDQRSADL